MLNTVIAPLVAGLGLFFSGLRLLDVHLRQSTGRYLRSLVGSMTRSPWIAGGVGVVAGALVQSASGIVFILVSLVASGFTTVARALPIVAWSNVGCSVLVFASVVDLRLAVLYLLGIAGTAYAFDRSRRHHAVGAVFGIGMLFYGIELMKSVSGPLQELPWLQEAIAGSRESLLLPFAGGAAFSFVSQSAAAVSILAIGLTQTGLFGPFPTMMAIYGANLGSTFSRMLLSNTLRGSARQLAAFQDLFKVAGVLLFVPLLYLEALAGIPLVLALVARLAERVESQMALVFLLFNLTMAVAFSFVMPSLLCLLGRWYPEDGEEDLAKPKFLFEEALGEPTTALELIDQEQIRLARRLRAYPAAMRAAPGSPARRADAVVREAFEAVAGRIEAFQQELLYRELGAEETERLTRLQSRLGLIGYAEDGLRALSNATVAVEPESRLGRQVATFVEALDFALLTLLDALEVQGASELETLLQITEDRGALMERVRKSYGSGDDGESRTDRATLFQVTSLFERIIWIIQRLAHQIERRDRVRMAPEA